MAVSDDRVVLTQDLDFSALLAISGAARPSVVSLRLASARVERVKEVLQRVLPGLEADLSAGAIAIVEDHRVRVRRLPIGQLR